MEAAKDRVVDGRALMGAASDLSFDDAAFPSRNCLSRLLEEAALVCVPNLFVGNVHRGFDIGDS